MTDFPRSPPDFPPWALIHADALDPAVGLAQLADDALDVAITDPPYSEHVHAHSRRGTARAGGAKRDLGFDALDARTREAIAEHLARLVKRWTLVFSDLENAHLWIDALERAGLEHVRFGIWRKVGATPQLTGDRPAVGAEAIVIAHRPGRKRWTGGGRHAVWEATTAHAARDGVVHPTQKPIALMATLVRDFSEPGEAILDPFAGSGTTGVASLRQGRGFVGYERDAIHYASAASRLESAREQLTCF